MHFDKAYAKNHRMVYMLASRITKDREAAKDIAQEVFIKLYKSIDQGVEIVNPEGWLTRTTCNSCLNYIRDTRKSHHDNVDEVQLSEPGIDTEIISSEETEKLQALLSTLKESEQILITLYSEGLSYKEISRISGIRFSSVGSTIARLLKKLKTLYYNGNK